MKAKLLLCSLLVVLLTQNAAAQERTNKAIPVISAQKLFTLNSATGWVKSTDGQWLEGKNKIQNITLSSQGKFNEGYYKLGQDNFTSFEIREVTVENRKLLILLKWLTTHKYAEPTTLEDISLQKIAYVVVDKNTGVLNKNTGQYELPIFFAGNVLQTENYIKDIVSQINSLAVRHPWISTSEGTDRLFYFCYKLSDSNANVARFMMFTHQDMAVDHLLLPIPIPFKLDKKPLRDYYFEIPATKGKIMADLLIK
ncbi:hypothetical protein [Flavobacterium lindanitolerans]|uniref:hypothetical protein n=1 Tax=Flavobacterium lindanitolerans TaxID=428988 RepID=UPI0027B93596|nr:hypothetical protein [Flavobacterium lindanitolerans]